MFFLYLITLVAVMVYIISTPISTGYVRPLFAAPSPSKCVQTDSLASVIQKYYEIIVTTVPMKIVTTVPTSPF